MKDNIESIDNDGVAIDHTKPCTNCGAMGRTESGLCKNCVASDVLGNPEGYDIRKISRYKDTGMNIAYNKLGSGGTMDKHGHKSEQMPSDSLANAMVRVADIVASSMKIDPKIAGGMTFESIAIAKHCVTIAVRCESVGLGAIKMTAKGIHLCVISDLGRQAIKDLIVSAVAYTIDRQVDMFEKPAA